MRWRNSRINGTAIALVTLGGNPIATLPARAPAHAPQFLARALDLVQDAAPVLEEKLARFGGRGPAAVAGEQVLPQLHLQQSHLPAECRLGHIEGDGSAREAAELGDAHKIFELLEIHDRAWERI